jgi:hypothetical protein
MFFHDSLLSVILVVLFKTLSVSSLKTNQRLGLGLGLEIHSYHLKDTIMMLNTKSVENFGKESIEKECSEKEIVFIRHGRTG